MNPKHLVGLHWLLYHQEERDWEHIRRMEYRSAKIFEWMWSDRGFCQKLLDHMPSDSIFLVRDYPLSEQRDWQTQPEETGIRHANEWKQKIDQGRFHLPLHRTYFLGVNEPSVWSHRDQAVRYYVAFLNRLTELGLFGGALSLGVGWPGTKDNTPKTLPDWEPYEPVHQAIVRGKHLLVLHEYGMPKEHGYGYWLMRLKHCPWRDVQIVIGECGIDERVGGLDHMGWRGTMSAEEYVEWLNVYHAWLSEDGRIHSFQPFTYDFSQPWGSFDLRPAREALERKVWTMKEAIPTKPPISTGSGPNPVILPPVLGDEWERSIEFVLSEEGGFQNHPEDVGNYYEGKLIGTKHGISARVWGGKYDIPSLTVDQAKEIYKEHYWQASGADKLAWPLCLLVFDTAVLHGAGVAANWLKEIGPNPFLFFSKRLKTYTDHAKWGVFGLGWTRRVQRLAQVLGQ